MTIARLDKESKVPLTFFITVFLVTYFINNDFEIGYIFNYGFIAGFMVVSLVFDGRIRLGKATLAYLLLVFAVALFSFLPNSVRDAESNIHAFFALVCFGCCALSLPSSTELYRSKKLLLFSALLMSLYVIVIKLEPDIYWNNIYPHLSSYVQNISTQLMRYDNYGVPIGGVMNYADYIFAMGLFICLGNILSGNVEGTSERRNNIILSVVFIAGMVIENRRSELVASIVAMLGMYLLSVDGFRFVVIKRLRRAICVIVMIIIVIAFLRSQGLLDRYVETFRDITSGNRVKIEDTGNGRAALWNLALKKFNSSPLVGIGWNQFRATNSALWMGGERLNAHNDFLQVLCETGIIGFAMIWPPMVYLWLKISNRCRLLFKNKSEHNSEAKSCVLISFGIQTFFVLLHFVEPCLYKLIFWPIFSFSIILYNRSEYIESQSNLVNNP